MENIVKRFFRNFLLYNKINQNEKVIKELYNAQLFNSTITDSKWLINKSFSPGRWAVGYIFLYVLYRILNETEPKKIIEFGIGQSTRMLSQYSDYKDESLVISFEHDQNWIDFFSKSFTISKNIEIRKTGLIKSEYKGFQSMAYETDSLKDQKFELILLDGPFGSKRYSRIHILKLIPDNIDKNNFCILMDDYDRPGEQDTAQEICSLLDAESIKYYTKTYYGQKNVFMICSENNRFLTSL